MNWPLTLQIPCDRNDFVDTSPDDTLCSQRAQDHYEEAVSELCVYVVVCLCDFVLCTIMAASINLLKCDNECRLAGLYSLIFK